MAYGTESTSQLWTPSSQDQDTERDRRDAAIAELDTHAGWIELKGLLLQVTRYERTSFDHPNWAAIRAHREGRIEQVLDTIKAVEAAVARTKARKAQGP